MTKTVKAITKCYFNIMVACLFLCFASGCAKEENKTMNANDNEVATWIVGTRYTIDDSGRSFSLSENEVQKLCDCEGKITL